VAGFLRYAGALASGNDFDVYRAAAHAVATGADPYAVDVGPNLVYRYPPTLAVALAPFDGVSRSVAGGAWVVLQLAGLLALIAGTAAMAGRGRVAAGLPAVAVGVAALFAVIDNDLLNGQVNALVLALLVAAWRRAGPAPAVAGLTLSLAIALKATPVLLLAAFLACRRWRAAGWTVAGLLLWLLLVPALALGPAGALEADGRWAETTLLPYARGADLHDTAEAGGDAPVREQVGCSLRATLHHWLTPSRAFPEPDWPVQHAFDLPAWVPDALWLLAGAAALLHLLRASRRAHGAGDLALLASWAGAMVILSPYSLLAHFVALLPAAAVLAREARAGWPARCALLALFGLSVLWWTGGEAVRQAVYTWGGPVGVALIACGVVTMRRSASIAS
jgi:hypothetical protein